MKSRLVRYAVKVGDQCEVAVEQALHDLVPSVAARSRRLLPQAPGLAESMLLVLIDVVVRVVLYRAIFEQRLGQTVPMLHRAQAPARRVQHVGVFYRELGVVHGRVEADLSCLVERSNHDLLGSTEKFDPGSAHLLNPANPFPGLLRSIDGPCFAGIESRIHFDARAGDLVCGEPFGHVDFPGRAMTAADRAAGGDAMGQPEFEDVVRRHILAGLLRVEVQMRVDEAGQQVHARNIDLPAAVQWRTVVGIDLEPGIADDIYFGDAVVFDDDIYRSLGGGAGAVDHVGAAQNQAFERTFAFVAFRNVGQPVLGESGARRKQGQGGSGERGLQSDRDSH